jgi:hypothetical protein
VERDDQEMIYSKKIRAGKRTYFFDVRSTRSNDYYLTITESRRFQKDGEFVFEKSKLFVYKEDLDKVAEALQDAVDYIKNELLPHVDFEQFRVAEEPRESTELDTSSSLKWD